MSTDDIRRELEMLKGTSAPPASYCNDKGEDALVHSVEDAGSSAHQNETNGSGDDTNDSEVHDCETVDELRELEELTRLARDAAGDSDVGDEAASKLHPDDTEETSIMETPMSRRRKASPTILVDVVVVSMGRKSRCSFQVNQYTEVESLLHQMYLRQDSSPIKNYRIICNRRCVGLRETFRSIVQEGCTRIKMMVVEAEECTNPAQSRFCLTVRSLKDYCGTFRVKPTDSVKALKKRVHANANSWGVGADEKWTLHLPGLPMLHYNHQLKDYGD